MHFIGNIICKHCMFILICRLIIYVILLPSRSEAARVPHVSMYLK